MGIGQRYVRRIRINCTLPLVEGQELYYWRNNLFANIITYLLPLCLIALVPGLYLSIAAGQHMLALWDVGLAGALTVIGLAPGISAARRKVALIGCMYLIGCVLIYYLGILGPGLMYLLIACIFSILLFSARHGYWPAVLNAAICVVTAVGIAFDWLPWRSLNPIDVGGWLAVSSNLVFLSFLSAALIPRMFTGLHQTIQKEKRLRRAVSNHQQSLQQAVTVMEQKNADLEQFAYGVSHDLQEPLRMITSFLTQLERKYKDIIDEKGKQYIHFAVDGGERMHRIIDELLEYARAGSAKNAPEPLDLTALINDVLLLLHRQIEASSAQVTAEGLPVIHAARTPMRQIFQNLISNAIKYSREAPRVHISAARTEAGWEFAVADNGLGIAPEYFEKIFVIFQRLHPAADYPGTGIGLAITRKLVESLGGKIWVTSEPGKGSTFHFTIPQ